MADLTLAGLRVVREVAVRGSFTGAADSLGYTQSAVSRQVSAMEAAAGATLFERGARGVRPTEAGQTLLRHAGEVLDRLDAAQRELQGLSSVAAGRLRVGAFPTAAAALLPRALARFGAAHPDLDVALREGTTPSQLRRVRSGSADIAVVGMLSGQPFDKAGIALEPLVDDSLLLAVGASHPLARRRTVDVDALADERWIAASIDPRDTFLGAFAALGWQPRIAFPVREWTAKLGLAAAGLGVTLVPGLAATAVREDVVLLRVRSPEPAARRVLLATRAGADPTPAARSFAELLHEVAAELAVELQRRIGGSLAGS
jgi:DNA-binding transcriptional LysR family regulator